MRAPGNWLVYRAFIEADAIAKWLPPNGFACTAHHLDAKAGGTFGMSFRNFTMGASHSFGGQYLELARRAPALHGQIRRSQFAGRDAGDAAHFRKLRNLEKSIFDVLASLVRLGHVTTRDGKAFTIRRAA